MELNPQTGFSVHRNYLNDGQIQRLRNTLPKSNRVSSCQRMENAKFRSLFNAICPDSKLLDGLLSVKIFDNTPQSNWYVPWHQDIQLKISTHPRDWTVMRIFLDDFPSDDFQVIPGSHLHGPLKSDELKFAVKNGKPLTLRQEKGDVLVMRNCLIHRSTKTNKPSRKILHLDLQTEFIHQKAIIS